MVMAGGLAFTLAILEQACHLMGGLTPHKQEPVFLFMRFRPAREDHL